MKYNLSRCSFHGGGGGIRTPGGRKPTAVFKTAAIDHSATPPGLLDPAGRAGGTRTPNRRFWRPLLYQLSYRPSCCPPLAEWSSTASPDQNGRPGGVLLPTARPPNHSITSLTRPAPIVRPPSRMANRCPFSIAMGAITLISTETLSPGITISTPGGRVTFPVTSVVRK